MEVVKGLFMVKIYFAGQDNFGNRGCEALIRSNVKTICEVIPGANFVVPSANVDNDRRQWLDHQNFNVEFIASEPMPSVIRWWSRAGRLIPAISNIRPRYKVSLHTQQALSVCDAVLMTGGDIISLDYGLGSLFYWQQICETAMSLGKKTVLWAGSVGPFTRLPAIEKIMIDFLNRLDLITVRETASLEYLNSLGIKNVQLVTDPAFSLNYQPGYGHQIFGTGKDVLGFNVSPLITKFRVDDENKNKLEQEVIAFLSDVIKSRNTSVLLVPHVDPLNGGVENSDSYFMGKILKQLRSQGFTTKDVDIVSPGYNAEQIKSIIGQCKYFMGARTHATVAALSQCIPTTSIAYSVKAKGINKDLFGHLEYVLETPKVSKDTLHAHFELLVEQREHIATYLAGKIPEWKRRSYRSAELLSSIILE